MACETVFGVVFSTLFWLPRLKGKACSRTGSLKFAFPLLLVVLFELTSATCVLAAQSNSAETVHSDKGEARISSVVSSWLKRPELQSCQVGVEIMHLPSGQILYSYNGSRRFVPASTAKVFVTACALDKLGGLFKYQTLLQAQGEIKGDQIKGDLVIVPAEDPSFEFQNLRDLVSVLRDRKIKRIDGAVKIASVAGGLDYFFPGWLAEDWGQEWMPVSSSLVIDRNVAPSADSGRGVMRTAAAVAPENDSLINTLLAAADLAPGWAKCDPVNSLIQVVRSTGSAGLVVTNPTTYNLVLFKSLLRSMGIRFSDSSHQGSKTQMLAEHLSQPLTLIIRHTLRLSDNFYAQQLLRTLGLSANTGRSSITNLEERGLRQIHDWLAGIGVKPAEVVLMDACGLSRKDGVTPHSLNMVLKHMSGEKLEGSYLDLMKAGGAPSGGNFRFKTGTMDSVRCISGVLRTASGDYLAVTAMINGAEPSSGSVKGALGSLTNTLLALPPLGLAGASAKSLPVSSVNTIAPRPVPHRRHRGRHHRRTH